MKTKDTDQRADRPVRQPARRIPIRYETRQFTVQPMYVGRPIPTRAAMRMTR